MLPAYNSFFLPVEDLYQDEEEAFAPELKDTIGSLKDIAKVLSDKVGISVVRSKDKNIASSSGDLNIIENPEINNNTRIPNNNEVSAGLQTGPIRFQKSPIWSAPREDLKKKKCWTW